LENTVWWTKQQRYQPCKVFLLPTCPTISRSKMSRQTEGRNKQTNRKNPSKASPGGMADGRSMFRMCSPPSTTSMFGTMTTVFGTTENGHARTIAWKAQTGSSKTEQHSTSDYQFGSSSTKQPNICAFGVFPRNIRFKLIIKNNKNIWKIVAASHSSENGWNFVQSGLNKGGHGLRLEIEIPGEVVLIPSAAGMAEFGTVETAANMAELYNRLSTMGPNDAFESWVQYKELRAKFHFLRP